MVTKHLRISGRVQGVGYRASAYYAALRFGLLGWVRNRRDGSVEAVVQGPDAAVKDFIKWAHSGPDLARVDGVDVMDGSGDFSEFAIKDTV